MNISVHEGTALIAVASSAIGQAYADRLARRGFDLILVAPVSGSLVDMAIRLTDQTRRSVETITADLMLNVDLAHVERVLRTDASITLLVSNPETGTLIETDAVLNVWRMVRLTSAVIPAFIARGKGTIINVLPGVSVVPGSLKSTQAASEAFVAIFTQSLQDEFAPQGIRLQAVMPNAAAAESSKTPGFPFNQSPAFRSALEAVDAALFGLDRGELVTIPGQPSQAARKPIEAKCLATGSGRSQGSPASPSKH